MCGVRYFSSKRAEKHHSVHSGQHRILSLIHRREIQHSACSEASTSVLHAFEHLPYLGKHKCRECELTVVVSDMRSVDSVVAELSAHLKSRYHLSFRLRANRWEDIVLEVGRLPAKSFPLSHHTFACYACEPEISIHESFPLLCMHSAQTHPLVAQIEKTVKRKNRDPSNEPTVSTPRGVLTDNGDAWGSRTCTLCNVVVWSEDDPHLLGKRHKKALATRHSPEYEFME